MWGSAFGATLALGVAVALVVVETFKCVVLEYGAVQAGRFIEWGFRELISSHTCVTIESIDQQSVERCFSVFEREVVWFERQSYVLYFISPLFDYNQYFGLPALFIFGCCCGVSISRHRHARVHRGDGGGSGTRYPNPRPVLRRGRGTLA